MQITNNSKALQGLQTANGIRYLKPGETKVLVLTRSQADRADRLEFISIEGEPIEDEDAPVIGSDGKEGVYIPAGEFNAMREDFEKLRKQLEERDAELAKLKGDGSAPSERDELKKQAAELGLEYPGNISNVKLKELIDAKLAS